MQTVVGQLQGMALENLLFCLKHQQNLYFQCKYCMMQVHQQIAILWNHLQLRVSFLKFQNFLFHWQIHLFSMLDHLLWSMKFLVIHHDLKFVAGNIIFQVYLCYQSYESDIFLILHQYF